MKVLKIGYLDGTDPMLLSYCAAMGFDTIPLSNGWDSHGKYLGLLTREDALALVVAPFHKLIPPSQVQQKASDFVNACRLQHVPLLVVVPEQVMGRARRKLGGTRTGVLWCSPGELFDKVMEILRR